MFKIISRDVGFLLGAGIFTDEFSYNLSYKLLVSLVMTLHYITFI
jgi:hypothetical protein